MRLYQIKVEYQSGEDRLLLRLASEDDNEVLMSLTRRVSRYLWQLLIDMAQSAPEIQLQANPEARHALFGFKHEAALSQANFDDMYDELPRDYPLGREPLLVSRLEKKRDDAGQHMLGLFPIEGEGIYLTLDDGLLHGLVKLLENGVNKADWALDLRVTPYPVPMYREGEGHLTLN